MFKKFSANALLLSSFFTISPLHGETLIRSQPVVQNLKEAYAQALQNNERISISAESIRQTEDFYRQVLGDSLPELSFRHQTVWQDQVSPASDGMIRLSKTGLTGYRELAALKSGKSVTSQAQWEFARAKQLLLFDVSAAYFGYLLSKENAIATRNLIELAQKRLKELKNRVSIGRSRESDAIQQEYQITTLNSQLEESDRQLKGRVDLLSFLTASSVSDVVMTEVSPINKSFILENYLAKSGDRPDVRAAAYSVESAEALLNIARGDHLPSVDLSANYYLYRPDARKNTDWDASATLNFSIWNWGEIRARVGIARSVVRQREQILSNLKRQAELEVRNAYRDYLSAQRQMEILKNSAELARRDYEIQARDDRRGLVTSLEVIESLNRLNNAELDYNSARLSTRLAVIQLELASGSTPEEILK